MRTVAKWLEALLAVIGVITVGYSLYLFWRDYVAAREQAMYADENC